MIGRDLSTATLPREAEAGRRPKAATRKRMYNRPETEVHIARQFSDLLQFIPYNYHQTVAQISKVNPDSMKLRMKSLEEHECGPEYWQQKGQHG